MKKYTVIQATEFNPETIALENEDGSISSIPTDPSNADYQAYLNKDTVPSNSSIPQAGE
jgi:hypothetical protein